MTYCHTTAQLNNYLDECDYWTAIEEDYIESAQYDVDLADFAGSEQEFVKSKAFERAVEAHELSYHDAKIDRYYSKQFGL